MTGGQEDGFDALARAAIEFRFAGKQSSEHPVLVLLGGPPGAGKSTAGQAIEHRLPGMTVLSGDDYRALHPDYEQLLLDPFAMPNATAAFTGIFVRYGIEYALDNRLDLVLEGTFVNSEVTLRTAQRFHDAGYRVEVVAAVASEQECRLSAEARYVLLAAASSPARWTPPGAITRAIERLPATVADLEASEIVALIEVTARSGSVYRGFRGDRGAGVVADWTMNTRLTGSQARSWLNEYREVRAIARQLPGYWDTRQVRETWLPITAVAIETRKAERASLPPSRAATMQRRHLKGRRH